jgi:kelch-like protein 10
VWEDVLRWINRDNENRKRNIAELMKEVRLGLLEPQFFIENIKNHPHVA